MIEREIGRRALWFALALLLLAGCDATGLVPLPAAPTNVVQTATAVPPISSLPTATSEDSTGAVSTEDAGTASPAPTLIPEAERDAIFDKVWQKVDEKYVYPDFHGVDWEAVRKEYRPQIEAATSNEQFYKLISDMVESLKDEHSRYLTPAEAQEEDRVINGTNNYVGIGILTDHEEKSILVVEVFPNSPAAQAGIKRGDRITAVDGQPFMDARKDTINIRGPEGTTVRLTVRSGGQPPREVAIVRHAVAGKVAPTSSRLDADSSIGYLIIPSLEAESMDDKVASALGKLLDAGDLKGLVIDLRGNGGGLDSVLKGILGQFVTGEVGSFRSQHDTNALDIAKGDLQERLSRVPVVVLVDKGTESFAEVLAAVLQAQGRAHVVGVPSAGNTEEIFAFDFEDGSRLWLAEYGFQLPGGVSLEGHGIMPDAPVDVDWTEYSERDDPQILKAVELIHEGS